MNNKICPLLSINDDSGSLSLCEGTRCAWYVPPLSAKSDGRCAVQLMGAAMPDLVQGVRSI